MSLAQHVTQAEGFDYERPLVDQPDQGLPVGTAGGETSIDNSNCRGETDISSDAPQWRPLSYALAETKPQEKPIAAYAVSLTRRWVQVITGVVACWLAAGIVFGFAAIKPVLIAEGVYNELCRTDDSTADGGGNVEDRVPCTKQDLRLNLFFTVASITANVGSLITGTVLDRAGRRACWIASSICLILGSLLMAAVPRLYGIDGYLVGNIFLALGGTFIFVSSFQLANTFPKHRGLIIALVTGAFDASAAVFLTYRAIYEATGFSLDKFFLTYIAVPVLILLTEISYMPARPYHTTPQLEQMIERAQDETRDIHDSDDEISEHGELNRVRSARAGRRAADLDMIEDVAGDADERGERAKADEDTREASGVWGVLHGLPASRQMRSPWFILILLLTSIQMLRMNYFIATIGAQYRYMLGPGADADGISRFFDGALPIGGLVATPFIGLLLNNLSVPKTFSVLTLFIVTVGVLNCLPFVWAGYATIIVFVIFRPLYYSAISDYATKVFGFATFGRIYGTLVCISGLTNFAQSGLDILTHGPLQGNPTPINAVFVAAGAVISVSLTAFVAVKGRAFVTEEKPALEASEERQRLLSTQRSTYAIA